MGEDWALRSEFRPGSVSDGNFTLQSSWVSPLSGTLLRGLGTPEFKVVWEVSHSEGDAGCSPLQSRIAQRAWLGTDVYRVTRWSTLGISKFPSWPQSMWGSSDSSHTIPVLPRMSSSDTYQAGKVQAAGVPGAGRGCLIDPTHCACTKTRKVPSRPSSLLLQ